MFDNNSQQWKKKLDITEHKLLTLSTAAQWWQWGNGLDLLKIDSHWIINDLEPRNKSKTKCLKIQRIKVLQWPI